MRGLVLRIDGRRIAGAMASGITGVIVTHKEGQCTLIFSSLDSTGMLSCTWYSATIDVGSRFTVCIENITETSPPTETLDYNDREKLDRLTLEAYQKLKAELIQEGVIADR